MKHYIKRTEIFDGTETTHYMDHDGHFTLSGTDGGHWFEQREDAEAYIETEQSDPKYDKPWMGTCTFEIVEGD